MGFDQHPIELTGDRVWLLDAAGKPSIWRPRSGANAPLPCALSWIENHFSDSTNHVANLIGCPSREGKIKSSI